MSHINFIPSELRPKLVIPGILYPVGLALVLTVYMGGMMVSNVISLHKKQDELISIDSENVGLATKIDGLSVAKERIKIEESMGGMKKILAKKNYWSGIFREMSVLMPEGVWLTGFSDHKEEKPESRVAARNPVQKKAEPSVLLIKGESSSQELIAQFLISLEKSHHFAGVQLMFTEKETDIRPMRFKFQFSVPITTATNGGG